MLNCSPELFDVCDFFRFIVLKCVVILLLALALEVFPGTISPSKAWGVAHAMSGNTDINQLANLKTSKTVATLTGFNHFEGANHSSISAVYSKDESVAAVVQSGKWEPTAACLVSTKTGVQLEMRLRVQKDAAVGLTKKPNSGYVFQIVGAKFESKIVSFSVMGEVPKSDRAPALYGSLSYPYDFANKQFLLAAPVVKPLTEKTSWKW